MKNDIIAYIYLNNNSVEILFILNIWISIKNNYLVQK